MVKIRLSRTGRKNYATYRIVITPAREKRESKVIEYIGYYLPHQKECKIDGERAKYWLSVGAQPTDTVRTLLVKQKLMAESKFKKVHTKQPGKKATSRKKAETTTGTK